FSDDLFLDNNQSKLLTDEQISDILDTSPSSEQSIKEDICFKNNKVSEIANQHDFILKKGNNQCEVDIKKILYVS
ncbi:unnamed protein product, partial [Adineta ricciae]